MERGWWTKLVIIVLVPLVALVELPVKVLLLILTLAAEAVFEIPVKVPDVAVGYAQFVMLLLVMATHLSFVEYWSPPSTWMAMKRPLGPELRDSS